MPDQTDWLRSGFQHNPHDGSQQHFGVGKQTCKPAPGKLCKTRRLTLLKLEIQLLENAA